MPFRVVRHRRAPPEFFPLPPHVRAVDERGIRRMARDPFASGPGYEVSPRSPPPGVVLSIWAMKVNGFRMFYIVDRETVKVGGFRARPGFYRKLSRANELLRGGSGSAVDRPGRFGPSGGEQPPPSCDDCRPKSDRTSKVSAARFSILDRSGAETPHLSSYSVQSLRSASTCGNRPALPRAGAPHAPGSVSQMG